MVLKWFRSSSEMSVEELIERKKHGKAIELLRQRFAAGERDSRLRLQLADCLVATGKAKEAVPILLGIADEHARGGQAAKAIATYKRVLAIDPGRGDVEARLATLIRKEDPGPPPAEAEMGVGFELPSAPPSEPPPPPPVAEEPDAVSTPLFRGLARDELLALIRGLRLERHEPGDVIITEGEPGESVYILTSGLVKAFVADPLLHDNFLRHMAEGSFFGEISHLTGGTRTATITAATACELLVLDRSALESIVAAHPNVREVLVEFYQQRAGSVDEQAARGFAT